MKKSLSTGFIDPVSLISLGIVVVGLIVTTAIVKNPDKLDIRNWAYELEDEELNFIKKAQKIKIIPKQPAQPPPGPAATTTKPDLEPEESRFIQQEAVKQTAPASQPTTPTQPVIPDSRLEEAETRFVQQETVKKPSPSPSPPPTTITKSDYQKCLDTGNTPSECSPIAQNIGKTIITPTGQTECTPNTKLCSNNNLKICSNSGTWGLTTCSNGCENNACKLTPTPTPTNSDLIATYNILNAVTFGAFGNYVQTYQDINAQNPQASYLQQAFNPQGIAASAQLGVVLTAEAAAVAALGPAAQATAGLPVAALMAQNALAAAPAWIKTAGDVINIGGTALSISDCLKNGAGGTLCQLYISAASGNPGTTSQALGNSLNNLAVNPVQNWLNNQLSGLDASSPSWGTLGTYGRQTILSTPHSSLFFNEYGYTQTLYDAFGNPILVADPFAKGGLGQVSMAYKPLH